MPEERDKEASRKLEQEVWSAISAFEQILEAMPTDIASLEALAHAYEQIGDHVRAKDYLFRLGNVVVADGDFEAARQLLEKTRRYAEDDPRVGELASKIEEGLREQREVEQQPATGAAPAAGKPAAAAFSMADELSFAWNLMEAKELTQDEYASVVHDLAEMSATDNSTTISVLHALEFSASKNLDRIIGFVSRSCATPVVCLGSFGFPVEAMAILPMDVMTRRGVLVFGFVGPEALVAVMNPYNQQLRKDVERAAGRKCHFFMALPSDFDQAVTRIRNQLEEKASAESR